MCLGRCILFFRIVIWEEKYDYEESVKGSIVA